LWKSRGQIARLLDCSVDEKLEKIKEELLQLGPLSWSINNLQTEITKLKEHDHKDGKIVIQLSLLAGLRLMG
jgi:hypothetical protein